MSANLTSWLQSYRTLLANAGSLIGTTVVTSGFGFLFWWLATRNFSPEEVGLGSAAISTMLFLGNVSVVGLGTLLIGELPRQPGMEGSLISTALFVVGVTGGLLGFVFAVIVPYISPGLLALAENVGDISLFAIGVSVTSITLVLDQAMVGLFRSDLQLWRNAIFAVVKLGAILVIGLWFSDKMDMVIYSTWLLGNLLSLSILAVYAVLKNGRRLSIRPQWGLLPRLRSAALGHHALNLALQMSGLLMPLVVAGVLSTRMNAYFYTSWMIASFTAVGPASLTTVLYAIGSSEPAALGNKIRLTLRLSALTGGLASIALLFGANLVLGIFTIAYAEQAGLSLRILALAVFPTIIKNHYIAICRINNRISTTAMWMIAGAILELFMGALGGILAGLVGLSVGWVTAMSIEALLMVQTVYRAALPLAPMDSQEYIIQP